MNLDDQKKIAQRWFSTLQGQICTALEDLEVTQPYRSPLVTITEPGKFIKTPWDRGAGEGGGLSALMHGRVFEKVGVNVSTVYGEFTPEFRHHIKGASQDPRFWAAGISFVAHPWSPWVPVIHMNTRLIITTTSWFGGGIDLTPIYPDPHDITVFHDKIKGVCDPHDLAYYPTFKEACDRYFYLPHRQEPRGAGGIFYDDLNSGNWDKDWAFTQDVGKSLLSIYPNLVKGQWQKPWGEVERQFQTQRRGRYVEFNLLYDRGTLFGLKTNGNVEAILMSLPPTVTW